MGKNKQKSPIGLFRLLIIGVISSIAVVGLLFMLFAAYETQTWIFWQAPTRLDQDTLFGVGRNAVTLAAALGVGVTLFFSYRKQQTAERAQELAVRAQSMALESQDLATRTLQLSLDKHDLDRVSELRNRYARSAEQLANEKEAIQMAGVHSLAALSDDWIEIQNEDERQVCVSLLCSYTSNGFDESSTSNANRNTPRTNAADVILSRLSPELSNTPRSWSDSSIKLRSAVLGRLDVTFGNGTFIFDACQWSSLTAGPFSLEGGRLNIAGNPAEKTFPRFVTGEFTSGLAEFSLHTERYTSLDFRGSRFLGSRVRIRLRSNSRSRLTFTDCEFEAGHVTISCPNYPSKVIFRGCRFLSTRMLRIIGPFSESDIELIDCIISDDSGDNPFNTDDFLAATKLIRTSGIGGVKASQSSLF